jgi:HEAT repeat protein
MDDESHPKRWVAVHCFATIALHYGTNTTPAALPVLADCMKSKDANALIYAALAIGDMRTQPETSVPLLVTALTNASLHVRRTAAIALGRFGPDAIAAVPELTRMGQQDSDGETRNAAIGALSKITRSDFPRRSFTLSTNETPGQPDTPK